jgi:multidrug resistance efflux pump
MLRDRFIISRSILTVINPQSVYLRAYVPEGDMGRIYTGKTARVFLDSNPTKALPAKIIAIDNNSVEIDIFSGQIFIGTQQG